MDVLRETFALLSRRNVPIIVIVGIDWMEGITYSPKAMYRAKHEIIISDVAEKLRYRRHREEVYGKREKQAEKEYYSGLDHSPPFYNDKVKAAEKSNGVATGDKSNAAIYLIALIISIAAVAVTLKRRIRER